MGFYYCLDAEITLNDEFVTIIADLMERAKNQPDGPVVNFWKQLNHPIAIEFAKNDRATSIPFGSDGRNNPPRTLIGKEWKFQCQSKNPYTVKKFIFEVVPKISDSAHIKFSDEEMEMCGRYIEYMIRDGQIVIDESNNVKPLEEYFCL